MRIKSLDLARGWTVLCIPAVHSILVYSQPTVRDTLPGQLLRFIAEGPGAQLFMLYMGIALVLARSAGRPLTWPTVLKRSGTWLLVAYGLNMLKFVIPLQWGGLPKNLQAELGVTNTCMASETVFLIGDILHFAALALPVTYGIFRLKHYARYAAVAAGGVLIFSPIGWDMAACSPVGHYIEQLIGGQPPAVYFPLLPWLTYPLAGLVIGHWLERNPPDRFLFIGLAGILLVMMGEWISYFDEPSGSFYRTRPGDTMVHMGIVCVWLWVWEGVTTYVKPNAFFRLLQYTSQSITWIYLIQWPLICWCVPFFGFQTLAYGASMTVALFMTGLTLFITLLIQAI